MPNGQQLLLSFALTEAASANQLRERSYKLSELLSQATVIFWPLKEPTKRLLQHMWHETVDHDFSRVQTPNASDV